MKNILLEALRLGATDIHMEEGKRPYYRIGSQLREAEHGEPFTIHHFWHLAAREILQKEPFQNKSFTLYEEGHDPVLSDEGRRERLWSIVVGDKQDFTYVLESYRFRVHMYKANDKLCAALRYLKEGQWSLENDVHGALWKKLCMKKEGLLLVTGPTGSGKSYTLASCLDYINRTREVHIVTIENPVEYTLESQKAIIHQREIGRDLSRVEDGLREALREDPDIIMIGEMRDYVTMEAALHAAETGHLVFATMHTSNARQAIGRIVSAFPGNKQEEVRSILSHVLGAVICQRLVRIEDHFVPIRDILLNTSAVGNLIRQGKEHQLKSIQETTREMTTFAASINEAMAIYGPNELLVQLGASLHV